jgi:hypothetical protein
MKRIIFWDMTPCNPLSFIRRFGGIYSLLACWFAEPISSTLKMEAICFSETSVETQRTTRRHIPEDNTLQLLHASLPALLDWFIFMRIDVTLGGQNKYYGYEMVPSVLYPFWNKI